MYPATSGFTDSSVPSTSDATKVVCDEAILSKTFAISAADRLDLADRHKTGSPPFGGDHSQPTVLDQSHQHPVNVERRAHSLDRVIEHRAQLQMLTHIAAYTSAQSAQSNTVFLLGGVPLGFGCQLIDGPGHSLHLGGTHLDNPDAAITGGQTLQGAGQPLEARNEPSGYCQSCGCPDHDGQHREEPDNEEPVPLCIASILLGLTGLVGEVAANDRLVGLESGKECVPVHRCSRSSDGSATGDGRIGVRGDPVLAGRALPAD